MYSLIASYITNFFVIIFFLPLLQDSATTWQNTNLKINFINFSFDFFGYLLNFLTMFDIYWMLWITHEDLFY